MAPKPAEKEREKAQQTAKLEADLKAYEGSLAAKFEAWEKKQSTAVRWLPIEPKSLKASNGAKLGKEAEGSILASGSDEPGVITVMAETDLTGITRRRLAMMTDGR